MAEGFTRRLKG